MTPAIPLRPVWKRPVDDERFRESADLPHLAQEIGLRVPGRPVVVQKDRVRTLNVAMKAHPVADPLEIVVFAQRVEDLASAKLVGAVGANRQRRRTRFARNVQGRVVFGNLDENLAHSIPVSNPVTEVAPRRQPLDRERLEDAGHRLQRRREQHGLGAFAQAYAIVDDRQRVECLHEALLTQVLGTIGSSAIARVSGQDPECGRLDLMHRWFPLVMVRMTIARSGRGGAMPGGDGPVVDAF
jgi:hypothetical protein